MSRAAGRAADRGGCGVRRRRHPAARRRRGRAACWRRPAGEAADGRDAGRATRRAADGLYGAAHGRPRRCGSSCSATPRPPGSACTGPARRPAALLASGLAAVAERPGGAAQRGAARRPLATTWTRQVDGLLRSPAPAPDVCVIMIGANDVTQRMPPTESVATSPRRCDGCGGGRRGGGGHLPRPGHDRAGRASRCAGWPAAPSRQLAAAQTIAVVEQGGRTVSLGDLLGPRVRGEPARDVRRRTTTTRRRGATRPRPWRCCRRWRGAGPVAASRRPAARGEASCPWPARRPRPRRRPGTEVHGTAFEGSERGPRGRWAALLRRRAMPPREAEAAPDPAHGPDEPLRGAAACGRRGGLRTGARPVTCDEPRPVIAATRPPPPALAAAGPVPWRSGSGGRRPAPHGTRVTIRPGSPRAARPTALDRALGEPLE